MTERSVKAQMRYALGPEVADHIGALISVVSHSVVPTMKQLEDRVGVLEFEKARIEDTLSAHLADLAKRLDRLEAGLAG